jgi:hypothetical protein
MARKRVLTRGEPELRHGADTFFNGHNNLLAAASSKDDAVTASGVSDYLGDTLRAIRRTSGDDMTRWGRALMPW